MTTIEDRIRAAEPDGTKALGGLIERLATQGRLRGARLGGKAIGTAALAGLPIRGVTHDSRRVTPGGLFVAIPGAHVDGHDFAETAVRCRRVRAPAGTAARARCCPARRDGHAAGIGRGRYLVVRGPQPGTRGARHHRHGRQDDDRVPGGRGAGGRGSRARELVSTVATRIGDDQEDNVEHATTPDAPELQATLRAMVAAGNRSAVVETTSHGLALERVGGIVYDAAILTNVTHEHLEFHGTWERYRDAKRSLFERLTGPPKSAAGRAWPKVAIVNHDDASAGLFVGTAQEAGARVLTYGTDPAADVRATEVQEDAAGLRFDFTAPSGAGRLELQLAGRFNVHNALAVLALGDAWELDPEAVQEGLRGVHRVPGRMERIDAGQPFEVVVDFAHSPASLSAVLDLLAPRRRRSRRWADRGVRVGGGARSRRSGRRWAASRASAAGWWSSPTRIRAARTASGSSTRSRRAPRRAGRRRGHDLLLIADRRAAIEAAFEAARPATSCCSPGRATSDRSIGPRRTAAVGRGRSRARRAGRRWLPPLNELAGPRGGTAADPDVHPMDVRRLGADHGAMRAVRRPALATVLLVLVAVLGAAVPPFAPAVAGVRAAEPEFPSGDSRLPHLRRDGVRGRRHRCRYPSIVQRFSVGRSYQGRQLWAVKVSDHVATDESEPEVVFDGLHHGDEHMSLEMTLAILRWLTQGYGTDKRIHAHRRQPRDLDRVRHQPGWRDLRHRRDRRVSRLAQEPPADTRSSSIGTDLNRNYDYRWGCCGGKTRNG